MIRQSYTAVVERNTVWEGSYSSEPYETAWASEAIFFVRCLESEEITGYRAKVQISPDGMHWCDEGTELLLPDSPGEVAFCRVRQFGGWLRLKGDLRAGSKITVIVYLALKE